MILGTGFAGIHAAKSVRRQLGEKVSVTLLGEKNHFVFTPMLHEAASGVIAAHLPAVPVRSITAKNGIRFVMAKAMRIHAKDNIVETTAGNLPYDTLLIATGAQTNYFGIAGAEEYALPLKTIADAQHIRRQLISRYEEALTVKDLTKRRELMTVVVVGAGPTGVEFAAEVASLMHDTLCPACDQELAPEDLRICLVNRSPRVLDMYPTSLQKKAMRALEKKGVELHLGEEVTKVEEGAVWTASGKRLGAGTVVWASGVRAHLPEFVDITPEITPLGRVSVTNELHLPEDAHIYVLGDAAHVPTKDGRGLPMLAQVAQQQGAYFGKVMKARLLGKVAKPFQAHLLGELVSLGRHAAIGLVFGIPISGFVASVLWKGVYLMKYGFMPGRLRILTDWFLGIVARRDMTIE